MDKPFSVLYDDTKTAIAEAATSSGLPPLVIRDILIALTENMSQVCAQQLRDERAAFEAQSSTDEP